MTIELLIAGRRIRLESREGVTLQPDERFRAFAVPSEAERFLLADTAPGLFSDADPGIFNAAIPFMPSEAEPDLVVDVEPGPVEIPAGAIKVFDAKLMEETSEGARATGEPFWEVFRDDEAVRARVFLKDPARSAVLEIPHGKMRWKIFAGILTSGPDSVLRSDSEHVADQVNLDSPDSKPAASPHAVTVHDKHSSGSESAAMPEAGTVRDGHISDLSAEHPGSGVSDITADPLPWPLDGLLLWFLCSLSGDMMIHGSGVVAGGRGWLFTGRSGSGKTTLARIFDGAGDRVIHDDRLVLRREGTGWVMHSTPVYRNDEPRTFSVDHLWVIRHGAANVSEPVAGAEAVAMIMANCIQQNWDGEAAARLAAAADDLSASVPVSRLSFLPDDSVRDYLLLRTTEDKIVASGALSEILSEGHAVTVTAGGYSMWPAIRPGDRVRISPPEEGSTPAPGTVVALRRDGGFVIHRVTDARRAGPEDHTGRTGSTGRIDRDSPSDQTGKDGSADQIRTRGDTSLTADPWISTGAIAGLVTLVTAEGDTIPVPRRRFPYLAGSLAATAAQMWSRIAGR